MAEQGQTRPRKEQEVKKDKRRSKAQASPYTFIKVARDEDLRKQIGNDIYFDLVNHDKVHSFTILKQMPFKYFKEQVAKKFGVPVQFQRFWLWAKRKNRTYRPNRPLTPQEEDQIVGALSEVSNDAPYFELKLFLEVEFGLDLRPIPPPEKNKEDILLFFKCYDPEKEELRYVGRLLVKRAGKPIETLSKLNEMAGFAPDDEIELFKEIKFVPSVMCESLGKRASFWFSQIKDGDIVCFQKRTPDKCKKQIRFPDVPSYLEYVKNRQVVHFRDLERPKEDEFCLELAKNQTYDDVVERVAQQLGLDDPSKIRLTSHNCFSDQPNSDPIKYRSADRFLNMRVYFNQERLNQISNILYYEVLDIPLPELQCLKTLKVAFHHATKDEAAILNFRLPKQSTVGAVLNDIKTKVELSHPNAELRLLAVLLNKIYQIFPVHEKIENIDESWALRVEEVPEEEKNMGPNDYLIHVSHFIKEIAQNQVLVQNFGDPFLLGIHEGEALADIKLRIQQKLHVPDEEFSKWKFAILSYGRPEIIDDSDIVSSRFKRRDVYGVYRDWEHYLGLEHYGTTPKRVYTVNQNHHTVEESPSVQTAVEELPPPSLIVQETAPPPPPAERAAAEKELPPTIISLDEEMVVEAPPTGSGEQVTPDVESVPAGVFYLNLGLPGEEIEESEAAPAPPVQRFSPVATTDTSPSTQLPPWMAAAPVSAFPQTSQPSQTRTEPSLSMLLFPVAPATEANASNPSLDLALTSSVAPKAVAPIPSAPASSSHDPMMMMMVQAVTHLSSGMVAMQQNISSGMAAMQQCISTLADIVKKGEERRVEEEASWKRKRDELERREEAEAERNKKRREDKE